MTDAIDEMFANDLSKLSMPSELAANAAAVKASQDPNKKGAEKPDLYAKGKGVGKGGRDSSEKNEERKSKGPNKGEKKDDMGKEAEAGPGAQDVTIQRHFKKRFLLPGMKQTGMSITSKGVLRPRQKEAGLDEQFDGDMRQIVGADVPEAAPDFERPDVKIAGQVNDAIDEHYVAWMRDKADEDVVKTAGFVRNVVNKIQQVGGEEGEKALKKLLAAATATGAAAGTAGTVAATKAMGREKKAGLDKEAGVIENPENADLLTRIRRAAQTHVHGSGDV